MFAALLVFAACPLVARGDLTLDGRVKVVFADVPTGRAILTERDAFIQALTPFDRRARLGSAEPVSEAEFLQHVGEQVQPWPTDKRKKLTALINTIRPKLAPFKLPLPDTVTFILTTGLEESHAAYTRGQAIVLPSSSFSSRGDYLKRKILHELFHIMSRHLAKTDVKRRDALYAIIGFQPCNPIQLPGSKAEYRVTNPDAPVIEHYVNIVTHKGELAVTPVIYSLEPNDDAGSKRPFLFYLQCQLMVLEQENGRWTPKLVGGEPVLRLPHKPSKPYFDQIGRNTRYIIHPDEILADNFVIMALNQTRGVETPRVPDEMRKVLTR